MEAIFCSETLESLWTTSCYTPEDRILQSGCENLERRLNNEQRDRNIRKFNIGSTKINNWPRSWTSDIRPALWLLILRSSLMFPIHLFLGLLCGRFTTGFSCYKILYLFIFWQALPYAHPVVLPLLSLRNNWKPYNWPIGKALGLYSGGAEPESRPRHLLCWLMISSFFFSLHKQILGYLN
jgi:hypothetical protein